MNLDKVLQAKGRSSFEEQLNRHYDGSLEAFYDELNRESDRLIRTDLKLAARLSRKTRHLESLVPDTYRAHLYRIWARHHHLAGEYGPARQLYEDAIRLFGKLRDGRNKANVQKALIDVLMYLGDYDRALKIGRSSLAYFRRIGSDVDCAKVLTNLGNLFHRLDRHRKALENYDLAYELFKRKKNTYALALVQFNRANIHVKLNDLATAQKLYTQSARLYRSLKMFLGAAQADYSQAYIAYLDGAYSKALSMLTASADQFKKLGDRRCAALCELDKVEIYLMLNLYSQAIDGALRVADEFKALNIGYEQGKAFYFAAEGYYAFRDFAQVSSHINLARRIFKAEKNQAWLIKCRFLQARVDSNSGRFGKAHEEFRTVAGFHKRNGDIRCQYDVRLAWLESAVRAQNIRLAANISGRLAKELRRMPAYQVFVYHMLAGDLARIRGNTTDATKDYLQAVKTARKLQSLIYPDDIRRYFWMDKIVAYNRLASIYLDNDEERKAFEILERAKTETIVLRHATGPSVRRIKIPENLKEEQARLKAYLRRVLLPTDATRRAVTNVGEIHSVEHRLWKLERDFRDRAYQELKITERKPVTVSSIREALKDDEFFLQYYVHNEQLGAFFIDKTSHEYINLGISAGVIRGLISRLFFLLTRISGQAKDRSVAINLLAEISRRLWHPLSERISGKTTLILVADDFFARIPWAGIRETDGSPLVESRKLFQYISASAFADDRRHGTAKQKVRHSSIVAATDSLPMARKESQLVAGYMKADDVFTGQAATGDNFRKALGERNGHVHLVAHASQSYENPLYSQIILSDGPFFSYDLGNMTVRSSLVVLSGCQTGDSGLSYKGSSLSLAHSFLLSGAQVVVASYWPVADEVACTFMREFYQHMVAGNDVSESLRLASIEMRKLSDDISHWAPFYAIRRQGEPVYVA